eukprot:747360-Hanusia_phi.AAC.1
MVEREGGGLGREAGKEEYRSVGTPSHLPLISYLSYSCSILRDRRKRRVCFMLPRTYLEARRRGRESGKATEEEDEDEGRETVRVGKERGKGDRQRLRVGDDDEAFNLAVLSSAPDDRFFKVTAHTSNSLQAHISIEGSRKEIKILLNGSAFTILLLPSSLLLAPHTSNPTSHIPSPFLLTFLTAVWPCLSCMHASSCGPSELRHHMLRCPDSEPAKR